MSHYMFHVYPEIHTGGLLACRDAKSKDAQLFAFSMQMFTPTVDRNLCKK